MFPTLTDIARLVFASRMKALDKHDAEGDELQRKVLQYLVSTAQNTEYGRNHKFSDIHSYDDFVNNVPVNSYEDVKADIDRMHHACRVLSSLKQIQVALCQLMWETQFTIELIINNY